MLCQNCHENEANVRYTEVINGVKRQIMLCEKCSRALGIDNIDFNMPIDIASFFADIINDYENSEFIPMFKTTQELKCDNCNLAYEDFIKTGKFGCEKCYDIFSEKIDPILKRIHGNDKYIGRNLKNGSRKISIDEIKEPKKETKLEKLENDLKKAISEERYEDAAKIRDEIKKIER